MCLKRTTFPDSNVRKCSIFLNLTMQEPSKQSLLVKLYPTVSSVKFKMLHKFRPIFLELKKQSQTILNAPNYLIFLFVSNNAKFSIKTACFLPAETK